MQWCFFCGMTASARTIERAYVSNLFTTFFQVRTCEHVVSKRASVTCFRFDLYHVFFSRMGVSFSGFLRGI